MAWKKIKERKWELKYKGRTIATIYEKSSSSYSLFVASPMVYETVANLLGKTYRFNSLAEAQEACDIKLRKQVYPWCKSVVSYFEEDTSVVMKNYLSIELMISSFNEVQEETARSLMDILWHQMTNEEHEWLDVREIPGLRHLDSESK